MMTERHSLGFDEFCAAIRAASKAYGEKEFVVVGRGSLSASMPATGPLLRSTEDIDLFPPPDEAKVAAWAVADQSLGLHSDFFAQHGFYVQRVGEWTLVTQPPSWRERAIRIEIDDITAIVLHPLDLAYNKLEAGRIKDLDFMREGLSSGAYKFDEVEAFIRGHAPDDSTRDLILANLNQAVQS
ncbi:MAG: DUF6036 family nucleotidyltransferase [Verrucomicrobiaceae bacterium]